MIKGIIKLKTIAFIFLLIASFLFLYSVKNTNKNLNNIYANSSCPATYTLDECYAYLEKQQAAVRNERKDLKNKLKQYAAEESSIYQKLQKVNTEIQDLELQEKEIKLKIEMLSLQITSYSERVKKIQNQIENYQQETLLVKEKLKNTFALKYALSSVPWYYYVAKGDIYSLFEMLELYKYYINNGEGQVEYFKLLSEQIQTQLSVLKTEQEKIEQNRNQIEEENLELSKLKATLQSKRAVQQNTLAQIRRNEEEVKKRMSQLKSAENQIDKALADILIQMLNSGDLPSRGTVAKGTIIGYQGHTGCSFGSHLHFVIYKNGYSIRPTTNGYLAFSGNYLVSGVGHAPLDGGYITQWYHEGYALDLVSMTRGLHNGSRYCVNKYQIKCPSYVYRQSWYKALPTTACFNQTGEGAPVYALMGGEISRGIDRNGSKYVIIKHPNGLVSMYFHLK